MRQKWQNSAESEKLFKYLTVNSHFGFAALTPALNPYSNLSNVALFIPPINATLLVSVFLAATNPAK